jgi:hypothetical protein
LLLLLFVFLFLSLFLLLASPASLRGVPARRVWPAVLVMRQRGNDSGGGRARRLMVRPRLRAPSVGLPAFSGKLHKHSKKLPAQSPSAPGANRVALRAKRGAAIAKLFALRLQPQSSAVEAFCFALDAPGLAHSAFCFAIGA